MPRKSKKPVEAPVEPTEETHVITEEDMELNPELAEVGVEVGEEIGIPLVSDESVAVSWDVFDKRGKYIRTYSIEIHGIDADKLAEQFASKIGGEVKVS